jgi:DNA-binding HxlR family transcriptional regulator
MEVKHMAGRHLALIAIFIFVALMTVPVGSSDVHSKIPILINSAIPASLVTLGGSPIVVLDDKKRVGIKEACKIIKEIMQPLKKGISADILNNLPPGQPKTFSTLKKEMKVPQTTLYNNLKTLEELGYVNKTEEWPAKYYASPEVEYVRLLATEIRERRLERLKSYSEVAPMEV